MCHFVISRVIPSFSAANSSMILNVLLLTIILCTAYARFHPDIHGRIIGGRDGDIKDHPYLISLVADGSSFCGAGLIHPQWALTSAHCMEHLKVEELTIRANSTYWEKGLAMTVKQIFSHPDFRHPTGDSDIALIQLSSPINCTYCKIISLSKTVPRKGEIGHIAGWGVTVVTSMDPWPVLQVADIPVVDFKECDESYTMISQPLTENMFCAGNIQEGGIDSCSGDSGGPLVINDTLVGLVSWGHNCALPAFPGVYTLVPKFLNWIKDISGVSVN